MKLISDLILLTALAMIALIGTITAEELTGEASENSTEDAAAGHVINPLLTVMGYAVLIVGAVIAINAYS